MAQHQPPSFQGSNISCTLGRYMHIHMYIYLLIIPWPNILSLDHFDWVSHFFFFFFFFGWVTSPAPFSGPRMTSSSSTFFLGGWRHPHPFLGWGWRHPRPPFFFFFGLCRVKSDYFYSFRSFVILWFFTESSWTTFTLLYFFVIL